MLVLGNEKELWCYFALGTSKPLLFLNKLQAVLLWILLQAYVTHGQCYYEPAIMSAWRHRDLTL